VFLKIVKSSAVGNANLSKETKATNSIINSSSGNTTKLKNDCLLIFLPALPIILYNVPGRTGSNVLPETTIALAEISNIVAMKEASGSMEQIMEIIRLRKPDFGVLSGDDAITMPLIAAGADGVISVVANAFPEKFSKMVHASMEGDLDTARKEHYDLLSITKMFFEEGNPGGVKVALAVRGIMEENMRLPLFPVSDGLRARIAEETKALLKV
jgi:4-hydroxy-tetrahydrodipicolinate synthase